MQVQQAAHTIGDLWSLWLADREKDGLSNTIYIANWKSLNRAFGSRSPALLSSDDCRDYARRRFAAGRSPWTVNTELSRLRACLKWAHAENLIPRVPRVWVPSRGKPRSRVLTFDEAKALITAAGDPHIHLFIVLAVATGARHAAILDLTWDRVDFVAGTIDYDEAAAADPMSRAWRKGRAMVPMGPRVRSELKRARTGALSDHVIEHGGCRLRGVRAGFAAAVARAGLSPEITPHTIRHTVATWLKERGVGLEQRAQLLGHADSRTTDTVYSHARADYLTGAVGIIESELAALPHRDRMTTVVEPKRSRKRVLVSQMDRPLKSASS